MTKSPISMPCAVIITALPVEYIAARAHLTNLVEEVHPEGTVYEYGTFLRNQSSWKVVLVEIGSGGLAAAVEAERVLAYFKPRVALFIGVAAGLKDVNIGDVVAVTKVYGYEAGRADKTFAPRPDVGNSTYRMQQRARAEARKADWLRCLDLSPSVAPPQSYIGPIAAGEKIITSKNSDIYKFLHAQFSDALAVEMEAHGFLKATQANHHVESLIVRGISDTLDNKTWADAHDNHELAAKHASAFAFEVLAKLTLSELQTVDESRRSGNKVNQYNNTFLGPIGQVVQGDHTRINLGTKNHSESLD
jgi:nucleoside phosphorylase